MVVTTLGEHCLQFGPMAKSGHGRRTNVCRTIAELDMQTLIWTRGEAFPLDMLESRLKCPRYGCRRVPRWSSSRRRRPENKWYDFSKSALPRGCWHGRNSFCVLGAGLTDIFSSRWKVGHCDLVHRCQLSGCGTPPINIQEGGLECRATSRGSTKKQRLPASV